MVILKQKKQLELNIDGQLTIFDSLNDLTKSEVLINQNRYFCNKCDKLVSALTKTKIEYLPKTTIFQLKRFKFAR